MWPLLVHPLATTTTLWGRETVRVGRASRRGGGSGAGAAALAPDPGLDLPDDLDGGEERGDDEEEGEGDCWTPRQAVTGPGSQVAVRARGWVDDEGGDEDGGEGEGEGEEEEEVAAENRRVKS